MTQRFHYRDKEAWETEVFKCPKCGWQGTFYETDYECHSHYMDAFCPTCIIREVKMLAFVDCSEPVDGNETKD